MNTYLTRLNWSKNKKKIIGGGIFLLVIVLILSINKNDNQGLAQYTVTKGDVTESLVLVGEVDPVFGAEMAFSTSGTVERIYKKAGDPVYAGEKIAELDNGGLRADLADALANLELKKAETKVSNAELDSDVENAFTNLLNNDLQAYPKNEGDDYSVPPPIVAGSFTGTTKGEYIITTYGSKASSGASFRYSGFESGSSTIHEYSLSTLGTMGLYLDFDESSSYQNTQWVIPIPNTRSSTYTTVLNAYQSALASRDASESNNISQEIARAKVRQAEAGVAKIQAEINERTIRAPFAGVVSKIDIKLGEIAEAGKVVTGVVSDGSYEVVVEVPEIDIVNLTTGLSVDIVLDAYGKDVVFKGMLTSIDPAETEVDGVSVYRAKVSFVEPDARVRSGMTASVSILKAKREAVLRVPSRFIQKDETGEFVLVENLTTETHDKAYIVTGLKGSDGYVEIRSGIKEDDVLIGEFDN